MSLRRLRGARILAEVRFVLGGAIVWGAAGFLVGLALAWRAGAATSLAWVTAVSRGFAFGWWGGVLWCTLLALTARSGAGSAPLPRLVRATWVGAALTAAVTVAVVLLGRPPLAGALVGATAATVAARIMVART